MEIGKIKQSQLTSIILLMLVFQTSAADFPGFLPVDCAPIGFIQSSIRTHLIQGRMREEEREVREEGEGREAREGGEAEG